MSSCQVFLQRSGLRGIRSPPLRALPGGDPALPSVSPRPTLSVHKHPFLVHLWGHSLRAQSCLCTGQVKDRYHTAFFFLIKSNDGCSRCGASWQHFQSAGMQVRSPAWNIDLKIRCCRSCGLGCSCGSDIIPGLGIRHAAERPKRKKKKKIMAVPAARASSRARD